MNALTSWNQDAIRYCKTIRENINTARRHGDPAQITISDLIPGLVFRETHPFDNSHSWRPIKKGIEGFNGLTPRKANPELAEWLVNSLRESIAATSSTQAHFLVIGDGEGDARVATNIAAIPECTAVGFIYRPEEASAMPHIRFDSSWARLTAMAIANIEQNSGRPIFLIIDIDKTLLMPKGIADRNYSRIMRDAFGFFLRHFLRDGYRGQKSGVNAMLDHLFIEEALALGAECVDYTTPGDHHKDEEVRILCALAYTLSGDRRVTQHSPHGLISLINKILDGEAEWSASFPQKAFDLDLLRREIAQARIDIEQREPSFFPLYRMYEEHALHELASAGYCVLNGHIIDIIAKAVSTRDNAGNPLALPIAYSDRPGNSVGIRLSANGRARPQRLRRSILEVPLPIDREPRPPQDT